MSSKRSKSNTRSGVTSRDLPTPQAGAQPAVEQQPTLASMLSLSGGDDTALRRWEWIFLALIVLAGGLLRFWRLGMPAMWGDEEGSLQLASRSLHDILVAPADVFPPGHYVLLHLSFMLFGTGDWSARLPGAIMGTAAIPIQYMISRFLFGRKIAFLSGLFACFSMYSMYYSRDAHGYGVYLFLGWLSLYFYCRILFSDGRRFSHWFGYATSSVLMVLTHFIGTVACLQQAIVGVILIAVRIWKRSAWGPTKRLILGFGASALIVGTGLAFYTGTFINTIKGKTVMSDPILLKITPEFLGFIFSRQGFGNGIGLCLFATLLLAGFIYVAARSRILAATMLLWIAFPYAIFAMVWLGHIAEVRYFIYAYPFTILFACCGIWALMKLGLRLSSGRSWGYAVAVPLLVVWGLKMIPAYDDFYRMTGHVWPKREMRDWVNATFPDGTTILYENYYELRWIGPDGYVMPNKNFAYLGIYNNPKEYVAQRMRDRFRAFLEKYPESLFYFSDDSRELQGPWSWPGSYFAHRKSFVNYHGLMLARRGLFHIDVGNDIWQDDYTRVSWLARSIYYNTDEDLAKMARNSGRMAFRRLIRGFHFYLTQQGNELMDWMVITDEGRMAIHQLDTMPRNVKITAQAVGVGANGLDISGPEGTTVGSLKLVEGRIQEYVVAVSNLPPGKTELSLKIRASQKLPAGRPPAVLFQNITVE